MKRAAFNGQKMRSAMSQAERWALGCALWTGLTVERCLMWLWMAPVGVAMAGVGYNLIMLAIKAISLPFGLRGLAYIRRIERETFDRPFFPLVWSELSAGQRIEVVINASIRWAMLEPAQIQLIRRLAVALKQRPDLAPFARAAGWSPAMLVWIYGIKSNALVWPGFCQIPEWDGLLAMQPFSGEWEERAGRFCMIRNQLDFKGLSVHEAIEKALGRRAVSGGWSQKETEQMDFFLNSMRSCFERSELTGCVGGGAYRQSEAPCVVSASKGRL